MSVMNFLVSLLIVGVFFSFLMVFFIKFCLFIFAFRAATKSRRHVLESRDSLDSTAQPLHGQIPTELLREAMESEPEVLIRCSQCRKLNEEHHKFCFECGASLT